MWLSRVLSRSLPSLLSALLYSYFSSKQWLQGCLACMWHKPGKRVLESHTELSPICLQNKEKSNSAQPCEEPDIWLVWNCMRPHPLSPAPFIITIWMFCVWTSVDTEPAQILWNRTSALSWFLILSTGTLLRDFKQHRSFLEVHSKGSLNTSALCGHGNCIWSSPHKNPVTNKLYTCYFSWLN